MSNVNEPDWINPDFDGGAPSAPVATPGRARLLDCDPEDYHKLPGLSASIAKILHEQSPLHAFYAHPCLGGGGGKKATAEMDMGSVVHALVLGKGKRFVVHDHKEYRTNEAKAVRDDAIASGRIPLKRDQYNHALATAEKITKQLGERGIVLSGQSEQGIEWTEDVPNYGPVLCRGMMDHFLGPSGEIIDLKISGDAAPAQVERSGENFGYAIQSHAYRRAVGLLRPELMGRAKMYFVTCEPAPPYAVSVGEGDGAFREIGQRRWERAVYLWAKCMSENHWPEYAGIFKLSVPKWVLHREGIGADD